MLIDNDTVVMTLEEFAALAENPPLVEGVPWREARCGVWYMYDKLGAKGRRIHVL